MPATKARILVDALLDAMQESGYAPVLIGHVREHPRKFVLTTPEGRSIRVWAYIWTLTFGGRESLPDEFRIQMTGVESPLAMNNAGPTLLVGYEANLKLFAGFDLARHQTFTPGSPSVQIDINVVRNALEHGITFDRKKNGEIAVGIRPDQFVNYAMNAEHLHRYGTSVRTFRLLSRAAALQPVTEADLAAIAGPRRRVVQTIERLSRNANFRQQVLRAYDYRCAVTRTQLRLVDAAHVLPVGAPGSTDHVTNGVALSPTYHRAFDNGLIYLDTEYVMRLNEPKRSELEAMNLLGGLDGFRAPLGRILLPPDRQQWPKPTIIRRANVFRTIQAS